MDNLAFNLFDTPRLMSLHSLLGKRRYLVDIRQSGQGLGGVSHRYLRQAREEFSVLLQSTDKQFTQGLISSKETTEVSLRLNQS